MTTTATMIAAARSLDDPAERASHVKRWFEVAVKLPDNREALAEECLGVRDSFARDPVVLDALGRELWRWNFTEEAIVVLRAARAAGSDEDMTIMLLGCMLLSQNNAEGVALVETALERASNWAMPRRALAGWFASREPSRAVAALSTATTGEELDLRAMANAELGRADDAAADERAALATYATERAARIKLADWHASNDRPARALAHARALLALVTHVKLASSQRDDVDATLARVFRANAVFGELVPRFRRQRRQFSEDVAWHVFAALVAMRPNPDVALAIRAARDLAEHQREKNNVREALIWEVRAASVPARATNDVTMLDALVASGDLGEDAEAWVEVAQHYQTANHSDVATAMADRALIIDHDSGSALYLMCRIAMSLGDHEALHRMAQATADRKPTWHQGPEFLARSFARRLDAKQALHHSARAIAMASYCNNSWVSRAEALAVAGQLDEARACLAKGERIHASKLGTESLMLGAALDRDPDELELHLTERVKDLPGTPFPDYIAYLRRLAVRG